MRKAMDENLRIYWEVFENSTGINRLSKREQDYFWREASLTRIKCQQSNNAEYAITKALPFDKQAMLKRWWEYLSYDEKESLLTHVWLNKGPGILYGYDWWLPYFEDTGFITNSDIDYLDDKESITLYRGALPFLKCGMSWTPDREFAELFVDQYEESRLYSVKVEFSEVLGVFEGIAGTIDDYENGIVYHKIEYVLDAATLDGRVKEI